MRIQDTFTVSIPVEDAWKVFLDIERIAPCMPGAQLQEAEGDEYRGIVKVKLGAITAQFKGAARFEEVDEADRRVVLRAEGREVRGQGNASATVTASLREAEGGGTEVVIDTDLSITGRVAQFGRGVMADVSSKLLGDFARCLEEDLLSGDGAQAAGTEAPPETSPADTAATPEERPGPAAAPTTGARRIEGPEAEPLDLMALGASSVAQRALPAAAVVVLLLLAVSKRPAIRWILAVLGVGLVGAREVSARQS